MALCLTIGSLAAVRTPSWAGISARTGSSRPEWWPSSPSNAVLIVLAGVGAMAFAWSRVIAVACQGLAVSRWYWSSLARSQLRGVLAFGLPLAGANLVNYTLPNADYAFVGHQLGPTPLGIYVLAFNLASWSMSMLAATINGVAMPAFSRVGQDQARLEAALHRSTRAGVPTRPAGSHADAGPGRAADRHPVRSHLEDGDPGARDPRRLRGRLRRGLETAAHRRQIRDWYDLWSLRGSSDAIVQDSPCQPAASRRAVTSAAADHGRWRRRGPPPAGRLRTYLLVEVAAIALGYGVAVLWGGAPATAGRRALVAAGAVTVGVPLLIKLRRELRQEAETRSAETLAVETDAKLRLVVGDVVSPIAELVGRVHQTTGRARAGVASRPAQAAGRGGGQPLGRRAGPGDLLRAGVGGDAGRGLVRAQRPVDDGVHR
jgi:Polysaccharide biosynthesis protein